MTDSERLQASDRHIKLNSAEASEQLNHPLRQNRIQSVQRLMIPTQGRTHHGDRSQSHSSNTHMAQAISSIPGIERRRGSAPEPCCDTAGTSDMPHTKVRHDAARRRSCHVGCEVPLSAITNQRDRICAAPDTSPLPGVEKLRGGTSGPQQQDIPPRAGSELCRRDMRTVDVEDITACGNEPWCTAGLIMQIVFGISMIGRH